MTTINHSKEQTYHIYRTRKHVRIAFNPIWVFQHGFKDLWFIGYQDELTYQDVVELDVEYIGCMTRSDFEKYCDRCYPVQSRF